MQTKASLLTIAQAAKFLKVSPDTLRRWEDKGIVTPQRTKGGSRRYTLLDLKIAKLNRKKPKFFQIPILLRQNYIHSKRDLKIALLTSFLWIFALYVYHFLTPIFLRPTNPEQQIVSDQPAGRAGQLKIASETTSKISAIKISLPDPAEGEARLWRQTPMANKITPGTAGVDLLISRFSDLPKLLYTDALDQYYSLQPLPQNQITSLIKRN